MQLARYPLAAPYLLNPVGVVGLVRESRRHRPTGARRRPDLDRAQRRRGRAEPRPARRRCRSFIVVSTRSAGSG
jgi:hypothetical protein